MKTLRSGEQLATTYAAAQTASAKTYHHMVPGARFIMEDGLEILFLGGQFTTADPEIIAALDAVVNKATSMIYTGQAAVDSVLAMQKQAADSAAGA